VAASDRRWRQVQPPWGHVNARSRSRQAQAETKHATIESCYTIIIQQPPKRTWAALKPSTHWSSNAYVTAWPAALPPPPLHVVA
jgi:DTW domain-containing protein YfiP